MALKLLRGESEPGWVKVFKFSPHTPAFIRRWNEVHGRASTGHPEAGYVCTYRVLSEKPPHARDLVLYRGGRR